MKRTYERPVIKKLQTSTLNKFGISSIGRQKVRTDIDGITIEDLVKTYGSPLFVYSEKTIHRKFRQFQRAFATRYPDVVFGWSYKTNYLKAICAVMHEQGAYAEIVSKMEYEKARALGIPGERIVFNGPHKPFDTLLEAVADGVTINIDHLDEVEDLERVAERLGKIVSVGLRLNLDAGITPQWSRFGLNLESGQALAAVRRIGLDIACRHWTLAAAFQAKVSCVGRICRPTLLFLPWKSTRRRFATRCIQTCDRSTIRG